MSRDEITHSDYTYIKHMIQSNSNVDTMVALNEITPDLFKEIIAEKPITMLIKFTNMFTDLTEMFPAESEKYQDLFEAMLGLLNDNGYDSEKRMTLKYMLTHNSRGWITKTILDQLPRDYIYDPNLFIHVVDNSKDDEEYITTCELLMDLFTDCGYSHEFNLRELLLERVNTQTYERFMRDNSISYIKYDM